MRTVADSTTTTGSPPEVGAYSTSRGHRWLVRSQPQPRFGGWRKVAAIAGRRSLGRLVCLHGSKAFRQPVDAARDLTNERSIAARSVSVGSLARIRSISAVRWSGLSRRSTTHPQTAESRVSARMTTWTPLLRREIAAMLSRGAPVARPLAVTRRLPVDVQTIATVPAEDESAAEQVFLGVYTAAR
jgi:hypothetical protein